MSDLEDKLRDMLKYEMKSSEIVEEVVSNYDLDEINSTMSDVATDVLSNIEDPDREKTFYILLYRLGKSFDSDSMINFAKESLEEYVDGEVGNA